MQDLLYKTFLSEPLKHADISFVMAEEEDRELLSHHSGHHLIPASNTKLFISAAALLLNDKKLFPPLQTFAQGPISQGVLKGDLVLDSCGSLIFSARFPDNADFVARDRALSQQIKRYVDQLSKAGIHTISGDLKMSFERWNAPPENEHYTSATAFSFNENTVDTLVENGLLRTIPSDPMVFNFETAETIESQDVAGGNRIRYNPKVDSKDFWRISGTSTTRYALSMLKQELKKQGVQILEQELPPGADKELLFETETFLGLDEFIAPLNKYSDNFRAELLALLLNRAQSGKAQYEGLNETIHRIFESNHLHLESLQIDDGSGLSRKNRVSAFDIHTLLRFMEKSASFNRFKNSLAIAGKAGTLKNRFRGAVWENSFYGKTGTLNGVSALSGYWFRENKPTITFAFIGNGAENKLFWKALEKFAASLESFA